MENNIAKELYGESLRLSELNLGPNSSTGNNQEGNGEDDIPDEDGSFCSSDEEPASDLGREWRKRHYEFHTSGYREGLLAGKESSAQKGFNIGFKKSVIPGYKLGLVRGVSSALACLSDDLREKLIESQEARDKFHHLFESVHSLSTTEALRLFHDDILAKKAVEQSKHTESYSRVSNLPEQRSDGSRLENYFNDLQSLLDKSSSINVHLPVN